MAASKGRSFVLKMGDGAGSEVFTQVGGIKTTGFQLSGEAVDVTTKDSAGWRALLADAGVKSMSISVDGIFNDSVIEETFRAAAAAQTIHNFQILDGTTGDKWQGAFQITSYSRAGDHNNAVTYSATLESSGAVTFTAA